MTTAAAALEGVQTPRVMSVPEHYSSAGQEVIELAEMAGLFLDPWQQLVIEHGFAERKDGRLSAFEVAVVVSRQNGKGAILEAAELGWLFLLKEPLILHTAHEVKTSSESFLRIKDLIERCPTLTKRCKKPRLVNGEQTIETLQGQRLRFVARSKGSGRGFTGHKVVLDEAYDLDERHMSALMPTLSAVPNPQIWYTSSAGMADSEVLNAICDRGAAGNEGRLAYFEWSADPKADLDDRAGWAQANPALGYRLTEEFISTAERAAMTDAAFSRERLGIREDSGAGGVIDLDTWMAQAEPESAIDGVMAFAIDTSPDRRWTSISSAGARADGKRHIEVIEHRAGTHWVTKRMLELRDSWSPCAIALDPGAAAGSLLPELVEAGIEVVTPTMREVGQACGALYDDVVAGSVRHIGQEVLDDAVRGARKRPLGDAWAWDRKNSTVDITPIVSATIAHWAWSTNHAQPSGGRMFIF